MYLNFGKVDRRDRLGGEKWTMQISNASKYYVFVSLLRCFVPNDALAVSPSNSRSHMSSSSAVAHRSASLIK